MFRTIGFKWICLPKILLIVLIYASVLHANTAGRIEGNVVDEETNEPIPNANVFIEGTLLGAAADANGHFFIQDISPGSYRLTCSAIGFQKETSSITIRPRRTTKVTFRLQQTLIRMNDMVVTASKYQQSIEDVPVRIDLVKSEDITARNAITLDQALQYVAGVQMAGNNISIRGSSSFSYGLGTRTLVLLDGVPFLSGDESKVIFEAIPVSEIEQVEVMKGAGSALYGSNAMGGVINIITKKPQADSSYADVSIYSGFYETPFYEQWRWSDSRRTFRGALLSYKTAFHGVASNFALNYHHNNNFKENADFRSWNFYSKFRFALGANNHWRIESGWLNREQGGFLFWQNLNNALRPGNEPDDSFTRTYSKHFYLQSNMIQTINSKLYYRLRFNYKRDHAKDVAVAQPGRHPQLTGTYRGSRAQTFGHEMQFAYQANATQNIVFGWDVSGVQVNSIQYGERNLVTGSAYSQYSWQFSPKCKLEIGGRWDREWVKDIPNSSQFNPKIGLSYHPSEHSHWRLSAGRGFRTPTISERFISTFANQIKVLPNHNLLPERNISYEVGFIQDLVHSVRIDMSYFFTDYWDLIEPQLQSNELAVRFENITRARIHGIEMSERFSLFDRQLQLQGSYTYIHTEDLSKMTNGEVNPDYGKELKYRPNHLLYFHASYNRHYWVTGADFRYISKVNRVDKLTNIPDINKQVPAYIVDVQFGFQKPNLSVMFIVNNILQYHYLISPGNLGDLRNYTLQFNWNYR